MKLFVNHQAKLATVDTADLARIMAGKHKMKITQYKTILGSPETSWEEFRSTRNNLEKQVLRTRIVTAIIGSEFKHEVKTYDETVAKRIYDVLETALTALHNFGVVTTTIFVGGKFCHNTYGTYIGKFKIMVSNNNSGLARSFLKLNLALPKDTKIVEHTGFGFNVFRNNPFTALTKTWDDFSSTCESLPSAIETATDTFAKLNSIVEPMNNFLKSGSSMVETLNEAMTTMIQWANSFIDGLQFILYPALRVLATYFIAPHLWRIQAGFAIVEIFIRKSHLVPLIVSKLGNYLTTTDKGTPVNKNRKINKNYKNEKTNKNFKTEKTQKEIEFDAINECSGIFTEAQKYLSPKAEAGALMNFITIILSAIFIFSPETQENKNSKRDGALTQEEEKSMLDKFYDYIGAAEDKFEDIDKSATRAEKLLRRIEDLTATTIAFMKGEQTSINVTELGIRVEKFLSLAEGFCDMDIMPILNGDAKLSAAQNKELKLFAPTVEGRAGLNGGLQHVLAEKIEQLHKEGNDLVSLMIDAKQARTGTYNKLQKTVNRLAQMSIANSDKFVRHGTTERCEPMFVLLSGPPGRGKTNAIKYLHQALFYIMGYTTYKEQRYNMDNQVYYYTGEKYFNNYKGQLIFSMDDIGQELGGVNKSVDTFLQIIRLCNSAPYNPPFAHLDDKCRMFTSEVITGTTNVALKGTASQGGINDPGAFQRRITFEFKLEADPEVLDFRGYDDSKIVNGKAMPIHCVNPAKVYAKYGKKVTPDIWQFIPLNPSSKEPIEEIMTAGLTFKCPKRTVDGVGYFDYDSVIRVLGNEYASRKIKFFESVEAQEDMVDHLRTVSDLLVDKYGDDDASYAHRAEAFVPQVVEENTQVKNKWTWGSNRADVEVCPYGLVCPSMMVNPNVRCDKKHSPEVNQVKHMAYIRNGMYTYIDGVLKYTSTADPVDDASIGVNVYPSYGWNSYLQDIAMSVDSGAGPMIAKIQGKWEEFSSGHREWVAESTERFKKFAAEMSTSTWGKWLAYTTGALTMLVTLYGMYTAYKSKSNGQDVEEQGLDGETAPERPRKGSGKPMHYKSHNRVNEHLTAANKRNRAAKVARATPYIGCSRLANDYQWEPARCRMTRFMNSTYEIVEATPDDTGTTTSGVSAIHNVVGTITFLRGLAGVSARHVAEAAGVVFRRGNVLLLRNQANKAGVRVNKDEINFYHCDFAGPNDMSVFVVADHIMAACPDLTQILTTEPETMGYGGRVPVYAYRLSATDGIVVVNGCEAEACPKRVQACSALPNQYNTNHFYLSSAGISGQSGGTVLIMANDGRASFLGVYRGTYEMRGLGVKVNNRRLLEHFNEVCKKNEICSWEIPEYYNKAPTASDSHYKGDFVHLGETDKPVFAPKKSAFMPSPIHGVVAPVVTAPAALKTFVNEEGTKVKPSVNAIEKYGKPNHYISSDLIETVLEAEFQSLKLTSYNKDLAKVYTVHQATYGVPGVQYIDAINASSSCGSIGRELYIQEYGKPLDGVVNNNTYKLNADYLTPEGDMVNGVLYREIAKMKAAMLSGKRPFVLWEDMPKDEPRPLKKVAAGKTRYFSCTANIAYLVMFRQYFAGFSAAVMQSKITNGYSVGTNVYGVDWDRTVDYVTAFGEDNIFAGDFEGFDSSHNRRLNLRVVDKINKYFYPEATDEENLIRRMLWYEIVESVHIHENDVYQWLKGQPSGNPITTILNCIVNNTSMRMVWDSVWAEIGNENMRSQYQFNKHVRHISYGDDSVTAVSDSVKHVYNQISVAKHQSKFGFKYTDEAKGENGDMVPFKNLREVGYLKRTFERDELYGHYIAPLSKATLNKMTQWVKKSGEDPNSQIVERCETAVKEAALHDSAYFKDFRKRVEDALDSVGLLKYARLPLDQHGIRAEIRSASEDPANKMADLSDL